MTELLLASSPQLARNAIRCHLPFNAACDSHAWLERYRCIAGSGLSPRTSSRGRDGAV